MTHVYDRESRACSMHECNDTSNMWCCHGRPTVWSIGITRQCWIDRYPWCSNINCRHTIVWKASKIVVAIKSCHRKNIRQIVVCWIASRHIIVGAIVSCCSNKHDPMLICLLNGLIQCCGITTTAPAIIRCYHIDSKISLEHGGIIYCCNCITCPSITVIA